MYVISELYATDREDIPMGLPSGSRFFKSSVWRIGYFGAIGTARNRELATRHRREFETVNLRFHYDPRLARIEDVDIDGKTREKIIKSGELSTEDKWLYGWIHMYMMNYCRDIAVEWYDKAVSDDPNDDPENYQLACMQRIWMFFLLKKEDEIISELREKVKSNPDNPRETDNLLIALIWAEKFDEAYSIFKETIKKFPDDWRMYIHGGDIAKELKKYDEALEYYNRAGEIGTYFCDEMDCKVGLYEEMGEYEKAYNECIKMADIYRSRGYDVEADIAEKRAEEIKRKIEK